MLDPYMAKTSAMLREGRSLLDRRAASLRATAPEYSALARRRKLQQLEARYADVVQRFEVLKAGPVTGIPELKVALEKSWEAFRAEIGLKA